MRMECRDVCEGQEALPVPVVGPPGELPEPFQYSPDLVGGPGAEAEPSEVTIQGCECVAEACAVGGCPCLPHGDHYVERRVIGGRHPILECNILCTCTEVCPNRESQRGLQFRLEVFRAAGKGWGLRTQEDIPRGRFVCEYAGEVLGQEEACRRTRCQDPNDNNYIIAVREHLHDGRVLQTYVDPTRIGNLGRFLNHSCEPNLFMLPVRSHSMVPRLALYAARDIRAGEELCYDYSGRTFNEEPNKDPPNEETGPRKRCLCGARACRGYLPYDALLYPDTD